MKTKEFLHRLDDARIAAAIAEAEGRSRGEVRVHVTSSHVDDVQAAAARTFERLGMTRTAERNGVMIYVAPRDQRFAVIGDAGIHAVCGEAFWREVADAMREEFKAGRFTDGNVAGIERTGQMLARHFPREEGRTDANELRDEVSRD